MTKSREQYTREFKLEAVRSLETSGKNPSQLERELGIGRGNLRRWQREFAAGGEDAFPGHGRLTPEQDRVRQLERENEILRQERHIPKKALATLLPKKMRFQFMEEQRDEFQMTRMCRVLGMSSSGYYAWRGRPPSAREMANQELANKIEAVYNDSHQTYGSPRVYRHLKVHGIASGENRVARLV